MSEPPTPGGRAARGGWLLGGRVRHDQRPDGHRSGIEPVLLAASIPARPGARVLEGGTGAGAALLCLAARVACLRGVGLERDPAQAAQARHNIAANGFTARADVGLLVLQGDLAVLRLEGVFDHAFANPPWHAAGGTASPDAGREGARRAVAGSFALWAERLAAPLRHHGTLSFVVAAAVLPECLAAMTRAGCGSATVLPLWPKPGLAARLVLLRAVKAGRGPCRMLPGLVLHRPEGGYTEAAEAVLRGGAALEF